MKLNSAVSCTFLGLLCLLPLGRAADTAGAIELSITNGTKYLALPLVSGVEEFSVLSTTNLGVPFGSEAGTIQGYLWSQPGEKSSEFFRVQMIPKDSNSVVLATLLNRLAYGPTPDELERVANLGPDGYIREQLSPESIEESLAIDRVNSSNDWQFLTVTGTAASSEIFIYMSGIGDCYVDDLKLVKGAVAESGVNTIQNGDFENGLTGWTVSPNLTNSAVVSSLSHSGQWSLHVVSGQPGTTEGSSIFRKDLGLTQNQAYTLSYWYHPGTSKSSSLVVRLANVNNATIPIQSSPGSLATRLALGVGNVNDLTAWHVLHAVQSKKQLLEVLLQFIDNHFVTQQSKSMDYLGQFYNDSTETDQIATNFEYRELNHWRQALLNPQCTFSDLLKVSAQSPAMIIYLDTVGSKGNGSNIANENYARELLELFTFGVDNGYDQNDITVASRAWTGWSIRLVDSTNVNNPFAPQTTVLRPDGTNTAKINNLDGVWAFNFKAENHNNSAKVIFPNKTVPARFGPPYAGRAYQLALPARSGTNSIQDGYALIAHIADQPFTQEFISVKLCRLLVHDDFATGYDFTDPNLSSEGQLVRECMRAWEEGVPKGQIRRVLNVIFQSDLFRSQAASAQKVKTPFEFTVSAVRALRGLAVDGTYTAETDGYSIRAPMNRMGRMILFNRDTPDGYPEAAAPWISSGTLTERLRFVQALLLPVNASGKADSGNANTSNPTKLLQTKLPQGSWSDPTAVAGYFVGILFPAEGRANLNQYLFQAIQYLNTADDGVTPSLFSALGSSTSAYDLRVRGMVAMLMTFQRFQEQ